MSETICEKEYRLLTRKGYVKPQVRKVGESKWEPLSRGYNESSITRDEAIELIRKNKDANTYEVEYF
jgi:hypothetical protein